jgi:hypothetical protein
MLESEALSLKTTNAVCCAANSPPAAWHFPNYAHDQIPMPDTAPNPNALVAARCTTSQDLLYHGPHHAAHTHLHGSLRDLNTVDKSVQLKNNYGFIGTVLSSF